MLVEILVFLLTFLLFYYIYLFKNVGSGFKKRGIKYLPGVPLFGNALRSTFLRRHMFEDIDRVYKSFPDERYVGYIEGTVPIILIRDPEIIRNITVKDFDSFVDHRPFFSSENEPMLGNSVFMMRGDKWREMRTTLSPAFTGSKMKHMVNFMVNISEVLVQYLREHTSEDIDLSDLMRRYSNDVIASAGFGLQVNSLHEKENEFYIKGQKMMNMTSLQRLCMIVSIKFPFIAKLLGVQSFSKDVTSFFRSLVKSTMEYREKNKVERPDMIQLLMKAAQGTLKSMKEEADNVGFATTEETVLTEGSVRKWTEDELTSQVFLFFIAGFESSASVLVMYCHELALNPKIQQKLYEEIRDFHRNQKDISYGNIGELKYLDCVLNETLRKWSPAIILDRCCTQQYTLPPPREGGQPVTVRPGEILYNCVNSIHMDPKYFPEPEKFDPERFSDENREKIQPFTFMPFGVGPRSCIASRFALVELKVVIYHLLLNFEIVKCKKTTEPIKLLPQDFNIRSKGGSFVKFAPRTEI